MELRYHFRQSLERALSVLTGYLCVGRVNARSLERFLKVLHVRDAPQLEE